MKKQESLAVNVFVIGFFEFFGTAFFGYCNLLSISYYSKIMDATGSTLVYYTNFAFALFMAICYGRQFSGGVYNPAIVLFRMLRRTDRVPIKVGLIYTFFQICGGTFGSFVAAYVWDLQTAPIPIVLPGYEQGKKFGAQCLSTFLLAFMVEIIINKKTTFLEHNRQAFFCIPLIFMTARGYAPFGNIVNPAFGVGFQLALAVKTNDWAAIRLICRRIISCMRFLICISTSIPSYEIICSKLTRKDVQIKYLETEGTTNRGKGIIKALKLGIKIVDQSARPPGALSDNQSVRIKLQNMVAQSNKPTIRHTYKQRQTLLRQSKRFGANKIATLGQGLTQQMMQFPFAFQRQFTVRFEQQKQKFGLQNINDEIQSIDEDELYLLSRQIELDELQKDKNEVEVHNTQKIEQSANLNNNPPVSKTS